MASTICLPTRYSRSALLPRISQVRAFALQKTMNPSTWVSNWALNLRFLGRARRRRKRRTKDPIIHPRSREAMNYLCEYVKDRKYDLRFALEAKPNEPRGDIYNATTGHMLAFIETLDYPEMVGVNPEVAHEPMAGVNFSHGVLRPWTQETLPHRPERPGFCRFDQDFRFGVSTQRARSSGEDCSRTIITTAAAISTRTPIARIMKV